MKLSLFINDNLERILVEWEAFTRTLLPAATGMTKLTLRDHAGPILQEAAREIGRQMQRVTATMTGMVNDLLEYARTQLGDSMPIVPKNENLENICRAAMHDASAAHPDCPFDLTVSGDLNGEFDGVRLQQVVTHLLTNAAQYRAKEHPVKLRALGEPNLLTVQVKNTGP